MCSAGSDQLIMAYYNLPLKILIFGPQKYNLGDTKMMEIASYVISYGSWLYLDDISR